MDKKEEKMCKDCFWIHQFSSKNGDYWCELPKKKKEINGKYIVKLNSKICQFFRLRQN